MVDKASEFKSCAGVFLAKELWPKWNTFLTERLARTRDTNLQILGRPTDTPREEVVKKRVSQDRTRQRAEFHLCRPRV